MFNLNPLHTFFCIAKAGSVSEGAKLAHITQSAASQCLKQLEDLYGLQLAERSRSGFSLTEAGKLLYQSCQHIFTECESVHQRLKGFQQAPEGELLLGSGITLAQLFLIPRLAQLKKQFPKIHLGLKIHSSSLHMEKALRSGEVDLACVNEEFIRGQTDLVTQCLPVQSEVVIYASPQYIKTMKLKKPEDVLRCAFIETNKTGMVSPWLLNHHGLSGKKFQEYIYVDMAIKEAALAGLGVAMSPLFYIQKEVKQGKLRVLFPQYWKVQRRDHICCLKRKYDLPHIKAIMQQLPLLK